MDRSHFVYHIGAWEHGVARPVSLCDMGHRYRRYLLADPREEEAMAGSLQRWGQLAPVAACEREGKLELLDGFKRQSAARQINGITSLSVRAGSVLKTINEKIPLLSIDCDDNLSPRDRRRDPR